MLKDLPRTHLVSLSEGKGTESRSASRDSLIADGTGTGSSKHFLGFFLK